jgi:pyruvate dehydrogenase E2 component (dihydrolipoamide acetyltransferase)
VPVVKGADKKELLQITKELNDLAEKARNRKLDLMDMKGGSFTITNYGSISGTYGTPVINPGESAILGLGRAFNRVVLINGKVENRKVLPVSLTFDHQILDGAEAARFLHDLKELLEK